MKFFSFLQSFGFTRNETKVVLLLSMTFLIGLTIRNFDSCNTSPTSMEPQFDYSVPDSVFLARSQKAVDDSGPRGADSIRPPSTIPSRKRSPQRIININTATKQELMQLPGIGEAYAERILIHREDNGPFTSIDQLEKIKGIGKRKLEQLRPYATTK